MHAQVVPTAPNNDTSTLLMAAMLPLLTNLAQKRPRSPSPARRSAPATPCRSKAVSLPFLSLPGQGSELHACLGDFLAASGLDLTDCEDVLLKQELTPDIIPEIPFDHLCTITGAVKGRIRKFQAYCKIWNVRLDGKREEHAAKRRRID